MENQVQEVRQKRKYTRRVKVEPVITEKDIAVDILTVDTVQAKAKLADDLAKMLLGIPDFVSGEELTKELIAKKPWKPMVKN